MEETLYTLLKDARRSETLPFTEEPSQGHFIYDRSEKDELTAAELFSQFTANIIKEEKIFTR